MFEKKIKISIFFTMFFVGIFCFSQAGFADAGLISGTGTLGQEYETYKTCVLDICSKADSGGNGYLACYNDLNKPDFASINGMKIRRGHELFNYANVACGAMVKDASSKKTFQTNFEIEATNKYLVAQLNQMMMSYEKGANDSLTYRKYESCMKDVCGDGSDGQGKYRNCWKLYKLNELSKQCDSVLDGQLKGMSIKAAFFEDISHAQAEACSSVPGAQSSADGSCSVGVSFLDQNGNTVAQQRFFTGEYGTCDQNYFNTDLGVKKEKVPWGRFFQAAATMATGVAKIFVGDWASAAADITSGASTAVTAGVQTANLTTHKNRGSCVVTATKSLIAYDGEDFLIAPPVR